MFRDGSQLHISDAVKELPQFLVTLSDGRPQLLAVHVTIIKQALEAFFRWTAYGGFFNVLEHVLQRFVQRVQFFLLLFGLFLCLAFLTVLIYSLADIAEQLRGFQEVAHRLDDVLDFLLREVRVLIRQGRIVKACIPGVPFVTVHAVRKVFGDIPIEHRIEYIALEVPSVHAAAQFIGNRPYRPVQFVPLLLFLQDWHCNASFAAYPLSYHSFYTDSTGNPKKSAYDSIIRHFSLTPLHKGLIIRHGVVFVWNRNHLT